MTKRDGVPFEESVACEMCGQFGSFAFDGHHLCAECYQKRGACCAEAEMDDDSGSVDDHTCRSRPGGSPDTPS